MNDDFCSIDTERSSNDQIKVYFFNYLQLPTEEVALKKFVETAKELEAATGKMYRSPLDEIAQQFNSSEKIEKNQNVRLKYKHIVIDGSNLAMK